MRPYFNPSRTASEVYFRRQRAFRHHAAAMTRLACAADPRTGGNETLIRNWGNAAANAVISRCWVRWNRYSMMADAAYHEALHRGHESEGRVGRYLWCDHCKAARNHDSQLIAA